MPITARVLFDGPHDPIAPVLRDLLGRCVEARIVTGFATVEGVRSIDPPIAHAPTKLKALVVGAGTYGGFLAMDRLLGLGVSPSAVLVHLGHTRETGQNAKHRFYRYHPMLHSKVYLFSLPEGRAAAVIGSNNVTGYALTGMNGEAATLIEGEASDPQFVAVRAHIDACIAESSPYTTAMKEAFTWWTGEMLEGLIQKTNSDRPRDEEKQRTIILLATLTEDGIPNQGEFVYFEVPTGLRLHRVNAEVHLYLFRTRPADPQAGLREAIVCREALWCRTTLVGEENRAAEVRADWCIDDRALGFLRRAPRPFRPNPATGMVQAVAEVVGPLFGRFDYEFTVAGSKWLPVYDRENVLQADAQHAELLRSLNVTPPEDKEWFLVRGLAAVEPDTDSDYAKAAEAARPESGSFVLVSPRRRKRKE
jgi:HKD family nuclease